VTVFSLLSWASAPSATFAEHKMRVDAEVRVAVLQTQVAGLLPTLIPVRCPAYPRC
jgi:hypothetical protein